MSITVGPYTVSRGEILPHDREAQTAQSVDEAEDDSVYVSERLNDVQFITARLRDNLTTIENVIYYIRNGVRYAAVPFWITDGFGRQWNVRYWGGKSIKWKYVGADLVEVNLKLRVEVP